MSLKKKGVMIVLSSPSGAGKTTLAKLISKIKIISYPSLIPLEHPDQTRPKGLIIILSIKKNSKI